jgi:putative restriction endonuclease
MIDALFNLKRAPSKKGKGQKAPHKPVLLLALIQEVEEGRITDNKVMITPELLASFKEIWSRLVEGHWQCKFFLPFYHLQNDKPKFWFLQTEPGASVMLTSSYSPKSVTGLIDAVKYATFADWLWEILANPAKREKLRLELLAHYFPQKMMSTDEVHRSSEAYRKQLELDFYDSIAADRLPTEYRLYEREARGTLFKNMIPKIYNHTCAISRQRIISVDDVQMIDACHIHPWSRSKDDSIQNGIALSPTLHRAFDRGIVTIKPDYTVSVSDAIAESGDSPFNLRQFEGRKILLPEREEWWPRV